MFESIYLWSHQNRSLEGKVNRWMSCACRSLDYKVDSPLSLQKGAVSQHRPHSPNTPEAPPTCTVSGSEMITNINHYQYIQTRFRTKHILHYFLPCLHYHRLCGFENSLFLNKEAFLYMSTIPPLGHKHG